MSSLTQLDSISFNDHHHQSKLIQSLELDSNLMDVTQPLKSTIHPLSSPFDFDFNSNSNSHSNYESDLILEKDSFINFFMDLNSNQNQKINSEIDSNELDLFSSDSNPSQPISNFNNLNFQSNSNSNSNSMPNTKSSIKMSTQPNLNPKSSSNMNLILFNPFYQSCSSPTIKNSSTDNLLLLSSTSTNLIENSNLIYENCKNLINENLTNLNLEELSTLNGFHHDFNQTNHNLMNHSNQFFEFNSNLNLLNDSSIPRQVHQNSLMNYSNEFYNVNQDEGNSRNLTNLSFLNPTCFDPLMSTNTNETNQQTPTTMNFLSTDPLSPIIEEGLMISSPNGVGTVTTDWNSFGINGAGGSSSPVSIDEHLLQQQQQQQTPESRGSLYFFSSSPIHRQENENEVDERFYSNLSNQSNSNQSNQNQDFLRISTSTEPNHELNHSQQESINPIELHSNSIQQTHPNLNQFYSDNYHQHQQFLNNSLNQKNWWEENNACPSSPSEVDKFQTQTNLSNKLIQEEELLKKPKGFIEKRYRTSTSTSLDEKPNSKRIKLSNTSTSTSTTTTTIKPNEMNSIRSNLNFECMPTKRSRGRRPPISPEVGLPILIDGNLDLKKFGMQSVPGGQAFDPSLNPNSDVIKFCELTKTGKPKKIFVCQVRGCGKCFKRSEHLKRHVRSIHTNHKPYKCPWLTCQKSFSRHDNLNQHLRVHRLEEGGERLNGLHVSSDGLIKSDLGEIKINPEEIGLKNVEIEICSIGF